MEGVIALFLGFFSIALVAVALQLSGFQRTSQVGARAVDAALKPLLMGLLRQLGRKKPTS